jgi:hypothetical protein
MTITPEQLKAARRLLGWSTSKLATRVGAIYGRRRSISILSAKSSNPQASSSSWATSCSEQRDRLSKTGIGVPQDGFDRGVVYRQTVDRNP